MRRSKKALARSKVIAQLDKLARAVVFERDNNTCQRCGSKNLPLLQWSHVISRRHYCIRWEPDNAQVLCMGDHYWFGNYPMEGAYWFSKNWPDRWERINELLRTGKPMKDANLRELLEEMTTVPATPYLKYPGPIKDYGLPF